MQGFILDRTWYCFWFSYFLRRILKDLKLTHHWSIIIYTNQNAELKAEASYSVKMKTMVLHIYSPTIIKFQMLCRSEDATKERRYLWKISCYFPLHWGRRKKLLLFMKISWGKRHEANSSLDKTAKLGISVLIPQPGRERRSSQPDCHSQLSTGQCSKWKNSSIF